MAGREPVSRVREVQALAERVFEEHTVALDWLARSNAALGHLTPLSCCATAEGAHSRSGGFCGPSSPAGWFNHGCLGGVTCAEARSMW